MNATARMSYEERSAHVPPPVIVAETSMMRQRGQLVLSTAAERSMSNTVAPPLSLVPMASMRWPEGCGGRCSAWQQHKRLQSQLGRNWRQL
eukprot:3386079-Pleurochrysis_carterae.AAC.1